MIDWKKISKQAKEDLANYRSKRNDRESKVTKEIQKVEKRGLR
jgi:gas vesicle protein